MIQIWQVPSECGPSNLVVLVLAKIIDNIGGSELANITFITMIRGKFTKNRSELLCTYLYQYD
jgi:hypothetical protein